MTRPARRCCGAAPPVAQSTAHARRTQLPNRRCNLLSPVSWRKPRLSIATYSIAPLREDKANAYLDLGRAYERSEKILEATEAYRQATRRQAQNPAAWPAARHPLRTAVAATARVAGVRPGGTALTAGLSNLEGAVEVLYQRAVVANRISNFAEARNLLAQALKLSTDIGSISQQILGAVATEHGRMPRLCRLRTGPGRCRQGDRDGSHEWPGESHRARFGGSRQRLFAEGRRRMKLARPTRRVSTTPADSIQERNEARALLSLGSLAMRFGDRDEAIRDIEQSMVWYRRGGYQKQTGDALMLLARLQRQKGDYPRRFAIVRAAVADRKTNCRFVAGRSGRAGQRHGYCWRSGDCRRR